MERIIMHIDMDAFFASVEQNRKPWLNGKPVGVTGNPDGRSVVATASYEARAFGVKSGMPLRLAKKLCPQIILVQTDFDEYIKVSKELIDLFHSFSPAVEGFSIDEAFLDLTYVVKDFDEAYKLGDIIKKSIRKKFNLSCTIGISFNKLLAKLAAKLSKPDGLRVIMPNEVQSILNPLPVGKITGIGRKTELILKEEFNVETIGQLQNVPLNDLVGIFHTYGKFLYNASLGIDNSEVVAEPDREDIKSIGNSMTFDNDTDDLSFIRGIFRFLSGKVADRLRAVNFYCSSVKIVIRYSDFHTVSHGKTISPTNLDSVIFETSTTLFKESYKGSKVRLLGVTVAGLTKKVDSSLYSEESNKKENKITSAIDDLRARFGFDKINYGSTKLSNKPSSSSVNPPHCANVKEELS
jgi:DNA polymerase-4